MAFQTLTLALVVQVASAAAPSSLPQPLNDSGWFAAAAAALGRDARGEDSSQGPASNLSEALAARVHATLRHALAFLCAVAAGGGGAPSASLPSAETLDELHRLCAGARAALKSDAASAASPGRGGALESTLKGSMEAAAWLQRLQQRG